MRVGNGLPGSRAGSQFPQSVGGSSCVPPPAPVAQWADVSVCPGAQTPAGSGCRLQCTWSQTSRARSRNAVQLYSDSLWNFITFVFIGRKSKILIDLSWMKGSWRAGTGHSPCENLMGLLKHQSSGSLQVIVSPTLAFRGVQLLHGQWLTGHS